MILVPDGRIHGSTGVPGILEGYASATSVALRAKEGDMPPDSTLRACSPVTCQDVFAHAKAGDKYAGHIVRETAKFLAIGCINVSRCFCPEVVLFTGGMALAGEELLGEVRTQYAQYHWNIAPLTVELRLAAVGNDAGVIGAAFVARRRSLQSSTTRSRGGA